MASQRQATAHDTPVPVQRRLYTMGEAAAIIGVTPRTIQRMVADGRLDALAINYHRYITRASLRRVLSEALVHPETRDYAEALLRSPFDEGPGR